MTYSLRLKALVPVSFILAASLLAACNTVEGAGKDLERGGEKVQDASRTVKQKL